MALITAAEIITMVSARNIDAGQILPLEIQVAENDYIKASLGSDLYDAVVTNTGAAYDAFIDDYVQPVLAYGVLSNIWNRLGVEVTDRGINRFTGEGIQSAQAVDKSDTLFEIRQRLSSCLGMMIEYAAAEYPDLYEDQDYKYKEVNYYSAHTKRNNAL
jgi:hypothetical protein